MITILCLFCFAEQTVTIGTTAWSDVSYVNKANWWPLSACFHCPDPDPSIPTFQAIQSRSKVCRYGSAVRGVCLALTMKQEQKAISRKSIRILLISCVIHPGEKNSTLCLVYWSAVFGAIGAFFRPRHLFLSPDQSSLLLPHLCNQQALIAVDIMLW